MQERDERFSDTQITPPNHETFQGLASYKGVYFLKQKHPNLDSFMQDFVKDMGKGEIDIFRWDDLEKEQIKLLEEAEKISVPIKSSEDLLKYPTDFQNLIHEITKIKHQRLVGDTGESLMTKEANDLLSAKAKMKPKKLYPGEFIFATEIALRLKLKEKTESDKSWKIGDPPIHVLFVEGTAGAGKSHLVEKSILPNVKGKRLIIVEKPGATALPRVESKIADLDDSIRDYGAGIFRDLNGQIIQFRDIPKEKLHIGYIGVVPGPEMDYLVFARDIIQKAMLMEDKEAGLKLANFATKAFGLPFSFTHESLQQFTTGANLEQVSKVRKAVIRTLLEAGMFEKGKLELPESIRFIIDKYIEAKEDKEDEELLEVEEFTHDPKFVNEIYIKAIELNDHDLAEIISKAIQFTQTFGESIPVIYINAFMLASARIFEMLSRGCDDVVILYNDPPIKIPSKEDIQQMQAA